MDEFRATHLPRGARAPQQWRPIGEGSPVLVPVWEPAGIGGLARVLRARADELRAWHDDDLIDAIAAAAQRLAAPSPERHTALELLPGVTGFSPAMVELVVDRMVRDWSGDALRRLLAAELPPGSLQEWLPGRDGTRFRFAPPGLAFNVFSGNVTGVAVTALIRCLLVRAPVLGKTAAGDPVLPVIFARALAEVAPELGDCVAVTYWPGGSGPLEGEALSAAELAVVYGGEVAVRSVLGMAPAGVRVVEHGPRLSAAFVAREALVDEAAASRLAKELAAAVSTFDQQGCVSPHMAFVERGGRVPPERFAELVFEAMRDWARHVPPGRPAVEEATTLRQEREAAEFREMAGRGRLMAGEAGVTVTVEDADQLRPSCLNRFLRILPVDDVQDAAPLLEPITGILQTAGLAATSGRLDELAAALARVGFTRVCPVSDMPWPPPEWHHDGQPPLRELLRRVQLEIG